MTDTSPEALDKLWHDLDSIGVIDDMEPQREDDIIELAMRTINALAAEKRAAEVSIPLAEYNPNTGGYQITLDALQVSLTHAAGIAWNSCRRYVLDRQSAALALQGKDARRLENVKALVLETRVWCAKNRRAKLRETLDAFCDQLDAAMESSHET